MKKGLKLGSSDNDINRNLEESEQMEKRSAKAEIERAKNDIKVAGALFYVLMAIIVGGLVIYAIVVPGRQVNTDDCIREMQMNHTNKSSDGN